MADNYCEHGYLFNLDNDRSGPRDAGWRVTYSGAKVDGGGYSSASWKFTRK